MKDRARKNVMIVGAVLIVVAIVFVILSLTKKTELYISGDSEPITTDYLLCSAHSPSNAFFESNDAKQNEHKVKIIFKNNSIESINYTYTAKFASEKIASEVMDAMHAKYNIYMNDIGIYQEDLLPTFSVIDTEDIINFSVKNNYYTSGISRLVFLDADSFIPIGNLTKEIVQDKLEERGFSCKNNK